MNYFEFTIKDNDKLKFILNNEAKTDKNLLFHIGNNKIIISPVYFSYFKEKYREYNFKYNN